MPKYDPLETTVAAYIWESEPGKNTSIPANVSNGFKGEPVTEEYFDNKRGVDFLGPSSYPFYLINAGQDLFYGSGNHLSAEYFDGSNQPDAAQGGKSIPEGGKSIAALAPPLGKYPFPPETPNNGSESDLDSMLSSIPSSAFLEDDHVANLDGPNDKKRSATRKSSWRHTLRELKTVAEVLPKPIKTPNHLKVRIDCTNRSFFRSLVNEQPEDICATIFYNGEFVFSKVLRSKTCRSAHEDSHPEISGRRVGVSLEVPWILLPMNIEQESTNVKRMKKIGGSMPGLTVSPNPTAPNTFKELTLEEADRLPDEERGGYMKALFASLKDSTPKSPASPLIDRGTLKARSRWDAINQSLLVEADEWGRDGKYDMFRTAVGEYLVELSKVPFPQNARLPYSDGLNIGVMDVVVSLGRSIIIDGYSCLREPQRKLTEARCGPNKQLFIVPKELRPIDLSNMVNTFQKEEKQAKAKNNRKSGTRSKTTASSTVKTKDGIESQDTVGSSALNTKPIKPQASNTVVESGNDVPLETGITAVVGPLSREQLSGRSITSTMPPPSTLPSESVPSTLQSSAIVDMGKMPLDTPNSGAPRTQTTPMPIPQKTYRGPGLVCPGVSVSAHEMVTLSGTEGPSYSTRSARSRASETSHPASTPQSSQEMADSIRKPPLRRRPQPEQANGVSIPSSATNAFNLDGFASDVDDRPRHLSEFAGYPASNLVQLAPAQSTMLFGEYSINFGFDGTGDDSKSTKRKRVSPGSFEAGHNAKVQRLGNKTKNAVAPNTPEQSQNALDRGNLEAANGSILQADNAHSSTTKNVQSIVEKESNEAATPTKKKHMMSTREVRSLFSPHNPSNIVDNSFGYSYEKNSSNRSTRSSLAKLKTLPTADPNASTSRHVTARIENRRILIIKGLQSREMVKGEGGYKPIMTRVSRSMTQSSLPIGTQNSTCADEALGSTQKSDQASQQALSEIPKSSYKKGEVANIFKVLSANLDVAEDMHFDMNSKIGHVKTFLPLDPASDNTTRRQVRAGSFLAIENKIEQPINDENLLPSSRSAGFRHPRQLDAVSKALPHMPLNSRTSMENTTKLQNPELDNVKSLETHVHATESPPAPNPDSKLDKNAKPKTPDTKQTKAKPSLSIQPGLANTHTARSYSVTPQGMKTPTPRSGTFPPGPTTRTRSTSRAAHDATDFPSYVAMPSLITTTPRNDPPVTPSSRDLLGLMSSPVAAPQATPSASRQTRILPPGSSIMKSLVTGPASKREVPNSSHTRDISIVSSVESEILLPLHPRATPLQMSTPEKKATLKPKTSQTKKNKGNAVGGWRPTELCQDSVLSYAGEGHTEVLPGLNYDSEADNFCRKTKNEREAVFRSSGILMGVRYVFGLTTHDNLGGGFKKC